MGYRSDVCLCIEKNKAAELKARYTMGNLPEAWVLFRDDAGIFEYYEDHNSFLVWSTYGVKWYPDYEDIQAVHEILDDLDAENPNLYGMIRIGEEVDDIEEWGEPWEFGLHVERGFSIG